MDPVTWFSIPAQDLEKVTMLEALSTLGLRSSGVELLPEILLRENLIVRLAARHAGRIARLSYHA